VQDVIGRIVDVKLLREERAQEESRRRRYALEEAVRELERSRQAATDYHSWRTAEEARLYDGIKGRLVRLSELEDLKTQVGILRARELDLQRRVDEADAARVKAVEAMQAAARALEDAVKARQKFEELFDLVESEARLERERAEEIELEEQFRLEPEDQQEVTA
jgi:type III secretion protein O